MSSRDIYYRDPELFIKQAVVDRCVDDLAYTLGVERDALNVVCCYPKLGITKVVSPVSLGCCCQRSGCSDTFKLTRNDDSNVDYAAEPEVGILVNAMLLG